MPPDRRLSGGRDPAGVLGEWRLLKLDGAKQPQTEQSFRMMYYGDVASGAVFSDVELYSSDYSLQLSMSLQNFISLRCAPKAQDANAPKPSIWGQLAQWGAAQRKAIRDLMSFGTPGPDGGPIPTALDR